MLAQESEQEAGAEPPRRASRAARRYWPAYLGSKSYRMTVTLRRAELEAAEGSGLTASTADPYVVVYVGSDREGTKQKTPIARKTLEPTWEHSMLFLNVSYDDTVTLEIKSEKQFAANELLCGVAVEVKDVMGAAGV